jgi:hypothetical protein
MEGHTSCWIHVYFIQSTLSNQMYCTVSQCDLQRAHHFFHNFGPQTVVPEFLDDILQHDETWGGGATIRLKNRADLSSPSSDIVKNARSFFCTPPVLPHGIWLCCIWIILPLPHIYI